MCSDLRRLKVKIRLQINSGFRKKRTLRRRVKCESVNLSTGFFFFILLLNESRYVIRLKINVAIQNTHFEIFVRLEGKNGESVDDVLVEQSGFLFFPAIRRRRPLSLLLYRYFILFTAVQLVFLGVHTLSPFAAFAAFDTLLFYVRFHSRLLSRHVSRSTHDNDNNSKLGPIARRSAGHLGRRVVITTTTNPSVITFSRLARTWDD